MSRTKFLLQLLALLVIFFSWQQIKAQDVSNNSNSEDDKIYSQKEVDIKAKVTKHANVKTAGECKKGKGFISLSVVLHKTGKVTDIKVIESSQCESFNKKAVKAVVKIEFDPAIKDGENVSQRQTIIYNYNVQ